MIFSNARYEIAAPAAVAAFETAESMTQARDNALETLSIMNSVRDADHFDRPLVETGTLRFIASVGIAIVVVPTLDQARAFIAQTETRFPRGRAIVEVDRRSGEALYTDHELEGADGAPELCLSCKLDLDRAAGRAVDPIEQNRAHLFGCSCDSYEGANADDFEVHFDTPEDEDGVETVTAPIADPAKLEGANVEIHARAIAAGIPADQLFAFDGEIWHRGAPLFLEDLPELPAPPKETDMLEPQTVRATYRWLHVPAHVESGELDLPLRADDGTIDLGALKRLLVPLPPLVREIYLEEPQNEEPGVVSWLIMDVDTESSLGALHVVMGAGA